MPHGATSLPRRRGHGTTGEVDDDVGHDLGSVGVVAREHDRRPAAGRLLHELVAERSPLDVEAGVGLVEEPERGPAREQPREPHPTALACRQRARRRRGEPPGQPDACERAAPSSIGRRIARSPNARFSVAELGVQGGAVAEEAHLASQVRAVPREVAAEDGARAAAQREQPREEVQQARLAGAVRAEDADDAPLVDVEVDAGEDRELPEQCHGRAE